MRKDFTLVGLRGRQSQRMDEEEGFSRKMIHFLSVE